MLAQKPLGKCEVVSDGPCQQADIAAFHLPRPGGIFRAAQQTVVGPRGYFRQAGGSAGGSHMCYLIRVGSSIRELVQVVFG